MYSSIVVAGTVRENPEFAIRSFNLNLKATSKLAFMAREDIERVIIKNLQYLPESRELKIDN